ncbi:DUF2497 domain-containing protein [Breoghania sp. L-A4]|uniref:PopZ family protein n=1 Tax=Breoghania sp. L-A4 TaxID=2304600 RepID=UPI0020BEAEF9|nr:DUF2497 domain-containing protein [Breoghania sp. L-A4]
MAAELDPEAGMSQDDLDKLFDEDGGGFDVAEAEPDPEPVEEDPFEAAEEAAGDDDSILELTEDFAVDPDDVDMVDMEAAMASGDGDIAFEGASEDESEADAAFAKAAAEAEAAEAAKAAARKAAPRHEPVMDASEYKPIPDHIEPIADQEALLSALTGGAVSSAFSSLNHTVLSNNGKTLDDLVREMLRPMLKAWLEANLPTVVERMVRQEIERVSRGR